jgi:seryl-tRNA synthetase
MAIQTDRRAAFLGALIEAGHLVPTGVRGVYGRGSQFEAIRAGLDDLVTRTAFDERAEVLHFPPVIPRHLLESSEYLRSFPHLAGTIFGFEGSEAEATEQFEAASNHEDWSRFQTMADLVLTPASCYPVYAAIGARPPLRPGGVTIDPGAAWVFRREPSDDPARLQMFQMRELVRIAEPGTALAWRDAWIDRGLALLRDLGLDAAPDVAADPFFGRAGRMLAASQREQQLKVELLVPIAGPEPTAVASFNYHQGYFATVNGIRFADGSEVHTACLGFGHERIVLALLREHGLDAGVWPAAVRERLRLEP